MRIAVMSDIHGNCVALDAALGDLQAQAVDQLICLGDAVQGGPQPAQVVGRLRALGCPVVMGNADAWLLSGEETGTEAISAERLCAMHEVRAWSLAQLSAEDRAYIATFPPTIEIDRDQGQVDKEHEDGKRRYRALNVAGWFCGRADDGPERPLGEGGERLHQWYSSGDTALPLPGTDMVFRISHASADLLREEWDTLGAMVVGRRTFDIVHGWGGNPPGGGSCFVVTHTAPQEWVKQGSPFTFVTDGVESAIRQAKNAAGDKNVAVSSATIAQQCIKAGLLDEIHIDLVPVLLGAGIRLLDNLGPGGIDLERTRVIEGIGVTHLRFRVVR